jgi:parallel beta-helix repeat protein
MKNQIVLFFVLLCGIVTTAGAKNYYVSAAGSDANTGLTSAAAWKTISKVNSSFGIIVAGDSILFRRGDIFYGALVVGKSGSSGKPIIFSAYGTGAKPLISGFTTLSSWSSVGNGIYQSAAPGGKASMNMVTLNDLPQALGRYPNADAADFGYLKYESFSGLTSITDNELTSAVNWTGAEVVIRKNLWGIDRCKITGHSGGTLTYANTSAGETPHNNYGYFIQKDPRTLDQLGEWYFNSSSKNLQMYFGTASPSSYTIKASTIDTLFIINTKSYINVSNIAFEGANGMTIYVNNTNDINIQNCDINNAGEMGIMSQNIANLLIDGCTTNHILSNAFKLNNSHVSNATVRNCVVKNTGTLRGMGLNGGHAYKAIIAFGLSNVTVAYNRVDTTGFVGIEFEGSNVTINNNVVNYFNFVKDDAGGIYTWSGSSDAVPGVVTTNRVIKNNIVMNGIGSPSGPGNNGSFTSGIHLDGRSVNIDVLNNTLFNNSKHGIHCNNAVGVNIKGNTFFNNTDGVSVMRWAATGQIKNLAIKNNICYAKAKTQTNFTYTNNAINEPTVTSFTSVLQSLGNLDSNYFSVTNPIGFYMEYYLTTGGAGVPASRAGLEGWQSMSTHDIQSKKPAKVPVSYKVNSIVGSTKFTNGTFTSNILGITLFGSSVAGVWDNTGKISGGSYKLSFTAPVANKVGTLYSPVGAISSAKSYILRFSTYGTTQQGIVNAYIRKSASPYTNLIPLQTKTFGIGRKDHEFLFTAPTTDAAGSFVIEIEQNSGTTYIDNIEFYEATATVFNTDDQVRFEYNASNTAKTILLDGSYTSVDGTVYNNTITLQPYTSKIMVKDTGSTSGPALTATATAAAVNCFGGTANVTVAATGGTAPYTGTGTFAVTAGIHNYTVTDAAGGSSTVAVTVTQPAAALQIAAIADTISVPGGTTTVTVAATGGTAPYTGTGTFTVTAGTYNYTVTDTKGCSSTVSVTVADAGGVALRAAASSSVAISCFGSTANVNVTATGGTAPYTGTGSFPVSAGKGSLKISFPASISGRYSSLYYTIGAISSTKNYILRFSTLGTATTGSLKAAIRLTKTPFTTIVTQQTATFSTTRKDHEFLFTAPPSQDFASFVISIDQASGTTYIDNIAFFEATADGKLIGDNLYKYGQFESNITNIIAYSSNNNQVTSWDNSSKISTPNYFTVTDAGTTTSVAVVNTTQPAAALSVTATAGAVDVATGLAPVTVTAAGGTAPYTGTGIFSKLPGTYTYTVTDANGCAASAVVTVTSVLARGVTPSSTNTATDAVTASKVFTVTAYPNPTTTSFGLMVEGGSNDRISIMVYSYDGKPVYQTSGNSNTKYTFGNNFVTGIYIVKVVQGTSTQTIKLIKAN